MTDEFERIRTIATNGLDAFQKNDDVDGMAQALIDIKTRCDRATPEGSHIVVLPGTDWARVTIAAAKQADDEDVSEHEREEFDRIVDELMDQAGPLDPYLMELEMGTRRRG